MSRLATDFWVQAYLMRLQLANIPAYVIARGDATAGSVIVKTSSLDGTARARQRSFDPVTGARNWMVLAEGSDSEVDAVLTRQRARDPDLWILEIEDRNGCDLLDEPGLLD